MKRCTRCKATKADEEFARNRNKADGKQSYCRACHSEMCRKGYPRYKARIDARNARVRRENTLWLLRYKMSHPCVDCGNADFRVLEFDHEGDKVMNVANMLHECWSLERIRREVAKCRVRCANCHRIKTAADLNWFRLAGEAALPEAA